LDLKEKLALPGLEIVLDGEHVHLARARSALENLGYSTAEVRSVLAGLQPPADESVEEVVRSALRALAEERRRA
jgi:Holliday junction resolvasome RuvABC DNA-binding subunit